MGWGVCVSRIGLCWPADVFDRGTCWAVPSGELAIALAAPCACFRRWCNAWRGGAVLDPAKPRRGCKRTFFSRSGRTDWNDADAFPPTAFNELRDRLGQ